MKMDALISSESLVPSCKDTCYHKDPKLHSLEIDLLSKSLTVCKTQVCRLNPSWKSSKDKSALIAIMLTTFQNQHPLWSHNYELTNLNISTLQSVTYCEVGSGCSLVKHGLDHCRQSSAKVTFTVNITSCVGNAHFMGI